MGPGDQVRVDHLSPSFCPFSSFLLCVSVPLWLVIYVQTLRCRDEGILSILRYFVTVRRATG